MKWLHSFRNALTLHFILVATLPMLFFGLLVGYLWERHLDEMATATNLRLAHEVRSDTEFFLVEARRELEQVAAILEKSGIVQAGQVDRFLASIAGNSLSFESLLVVDRNGKVMHAGLAEDGKEQFRDFLGIDLGHHELLVDGPLETPRWSTTFLSLVSGRATVTLGIPLPQGALLGNVSLKNLSDNISRLMMTSEHIALAIVGLDKTVIVSNRPQEVFQQVSFGNHPEVVRALNGNEGTSEDIHGDVRYIESVLSVPETGWAVWVAQNLEYVKAPAASLRQTLILFMLITAAVAVATAVRKSRMLMRPLQGLLQSVVRIGKGNYQVTTTESRYHEIDELAAGVREMAEAIDVREDHLRESEERFRLLFSLNPDATLLVRADSGVIVDVNEVFLRESGYAREDVLGRTTLEIGVWRDKAQRDEFFATIREKKTISNILIPLSGIVAAEEGLLSATLVEIGGESFILSMVRDISEVRRTERQLRRLSEEFRALLEGIPDQILLVDRDYRVIWRNHTDSEKVSDHFQLCHRLFYQRDTPCDNCPVAAALTSGSIEEGEMTTADGRHLQLRAIPIATGDDPVEKVIMISQEVTEKVRLQQQQMHNRQLAALGELAAGVAHEINNPVNGIINYAQLLKNRFSDNEQILGLSERVIKEGNRIASIVRELLYFAREGGDEVHTTTWRQVVEESLLLVGNQLRREHVHLDVEFPAELPEISSISTQLQQVILNLISNARHALSERYPGEDDLKRLRIVGSPADAGRVRLDITDLGSGIPPSQLDKVLQPFFTTKAAGVGTGLGLSICHEIIKRHGGTLEIFSEVGKYTRVSIVLPAASAAVAIKND